MINDSPQRPEQSDAIGKGMVYVKSIAVEDLPQEMQAEAEGLEELVSVHSHTGEQLAVVANRSLAFELARQHQMSPVTVH